MPVVSTEKHVRSVMDPVQIKKFINNYLDQMPTRSRVTMYDLSDHVFNTFKCTKKIAYKLVGEVITARQDFHVYRGMGACKL